MVSSSRPLNRSSSGRFTRRGPKNIATAESNENHAEPSATAPASQDALLIARTPVAPSEDDSAAPTTDQTLKLLGPRPAARNRGSSRRKGATPIASTEQQQQHPKPPTKVTVTQPHGGLVQSTNGVQTSLNLREDDVPSHSATPKPDVQGGLAVPAGTSQSQDKRTLRSQDGGSRLKSDLAIYFPNYDDVIAGVERKPGTLTCLYRADIKADAGQIFSTSMSPSTSLTSLSPTPCLLLDRCSRFLPPLRHRKSGVPPCSLPPIPRPISPRHSTGTSHTPK